MTEQRSDGERRDAKSYTEQLEIERLQTQPAWLSPQEMMMPLPKMGKLERRDPREMWMLNLK